MIYAELSLTESPGAHAAILGCPLLTRDARRYRSWFPTVELIAPA